jgi:hypothetical protein
MCDTTPQHTDAPMHHLGTLVAPGLECLINVIAHMEHHRGLSLPVSQFRLFPWGRLRDTALQSVVMRLVQVSVTFSEVAFGRLKHSAKLWCVRGSPESLRSSSLQALYVDCPRVRRRAVCMR